VEERALLEYFEAMEAVRTALRAGDG